MLTFLAEFQNKPYYRERFNIAVGLANKKLDIEEVAETTGQCRDQYPPQTEDLEIKRKNLTSNNSNSVSSNCKNGTPSRDVEHNKELTSTPNSGSASRSHSFIAELEMTPTRINTQNRSLKRPVKRTKNGPRKGAKKMKESSSSEDNHPADMINNSVNDNTVTPCNSSSENESEDGLPAISMTQTPTKGYSSCKFCIVSSKRDDNLLLCSERCEE